MKPNLFYYMSLFIPGSAHIALKKWKLGLIGIGIFILEVVSFITIMLPNFALLFVRHTSGPYAGAITIGAQEYVDDSFIILVAAVFSILLILIFLFIHYAFARDARAIAQQINEYGYATSTMEKMKEISSEIIPNAITAPKFILIFVFIFLPAVVSIFIAFTNYQNPILPPAFLIEWNGLENFSTVIFDERTRAAFTDTLTWTIIWTFSATTLTITLGTLLAIVANNKRIKGKRFFRTVYLLPWAVPAFLTILIFQIFFSRIGTMNTIVIPFFTGTPYSVANAVGFFQDPLLARITIILIQAWLGFPYIFILVTGVLQTIPDDLYEASNIDGGNVFTNFFDITLPLILISVAPVFITQFTFNFNNVTIIYLLSDSVVKNIGAVYGPLDTVASLGFRLMLDAKFSQAAVYTLIVSTIVGVIVLYSWIKTGAFKNEEVM